jgi:hypothetical protein
MEFDSVSVFPHSTGQGTLDEYPQPITEDVVEEREAAEGPRTERRICPEGESSEPPEATETSGEPDQLYLRGQPRMLEITDTVDEDVEPDFVPISFLYDDGHGTLEEGKNEYDGTLYQEESYQDPESHQTQKYASVK